MAARPSTPRGRAARPCGRAVDARCRTDRASNARALGRRRLCRRARRDVDSARGAHHRGLRGLRRDDERPAVSPRPADVAGGRRAAPLLGVAVRPAGRVRVLPSPRRHRTAAAGGSDGSWIGDCRCPENNSVVWAGTRREGIAQMTEIVQPQMSTTTPNHGHSRLFLTAVALLAAACGLAVWWLVIRSHAPASPPQTVPSTHQAVAVSETGLQTLA